LSAFSLVSVEDVDGFLEEEEEEEDVGHKRTSRH